MPTSFVRPPALTLQAPGAVLAGHSLPPGRPRPVGERGREQLGQLPEALHGAGRRARVGDRPRARQGLLVKDGGAPTGQPQHGLEPAPRERRGRRPRSPGWRDPGARRRGSATDGEGEASGAARRRPHGSGSHARRPSRRPGCPGMPGEPRLGVGDSCEGIVACVTAVTHKRAFAWHSARLHGQPLGHAPPIGALIDRPGDLEARLAGALSEAGAACAPLAPRRRRAVAPQRRRAAPNGGGSSVSAARRKLIAAASALGLGLSVASQAIGAPAHPAAKQRPERRLVRSIAVAPSAGDQAELAVLDKPGDRFHSGRDCSSPGPQGPEAGRQSTREAGSAGLEPVSPRDFPPRVGLVSPAPR